MPNVILGHVSKFVIILGSAQTQVFKSIFSLKCSGLKYLKNQYWTTSKIDPTGYHPENISSYYKKYEILSPFIDTQACVGAT